MGNQQERLFDLGWLVGSFESEGGFCLAKSCCNKRGWRYTPLCTISNTDNNFIFACIEILKSLDIPHYVCFKRSTGKHRPCRDIIIRGYQRCDKFLKFIIPLLKTKKDQANLMREFIDYRLSKNYRYPYGEYEDNAHKRMKELNKIPRDYTPDFINK
jgi:hypothetical protein